MMKLRSGPIVVLRVVFSALLIRLQITYRKAVIDGLLVYMRMHPVYMTSGASDANNA